MRRIAVQPPISRRTFLTLAAAGAPGVVWATVAGKKDTTVRDCLWAWAHDTGAYHGPAWGLPGNSALTPVEGARYLGMPNIIFIRYQGKPEAPFDGYFTPFKSMKRVFWSIAGAGGVTSEEEREQVLRLAEANPNITGVFMDDFFQFSTAEKPQWLAENKVAFPVTLTVSLPAAQTVDTVELVQSDWHSGDYRSRDVAVQVSADGSDWSLAGAGCLPNQPGAAFSIAIRPTVLRAFRIRILSSYDTKDALSCGISRVRLLCKKRESSLSGATVTASSTYPGHDAADILAATAAGPAAASLSVEQLKTVRNRLENVAGRKLDLGVTLYTHQLDPSITAHLDLCDVVSLWTWKAEDLKNLESNFGRFRQLAPSKRTLLGCYMWDFGTNKAMPLDLMQRQCELGLKWLRQGRIEGMIFLATNICDLGLEAVEWTRKWIARIGNEPVLPL